MTATETESKNLIELVVARPAPITDGSALLERVTALSVVNLTSYEMVATVRANARTRWAAIEKQRKEMKEPSKEEINA